MKYIVTADTDIGIAKETNQDSICVRVANYKEEQIVMAIICDGMGGLSKGEVASATVIKDFCKWFEEELPLHMNKLSWEYLTEEWDKIAKNCNTKIMKYGKKNSVNIGTTMVGIFIYNEKYMLFNIGDSRIYKISSSRNIKQITEDQTLVQHEIKMGNMTIEQAKKDPRRSVLLQCIGATRTLKPEIRLGKIESKCMYMLCSDGFRNKIDEEEIGDNLSPKVLKNKSDMHQSSLNLIDTLKKRFEKDNISVVLIKTEE